MTLVAGPSKHPQLSSCACFEATMAQQLAWRALHPPELCHSHPVRPPHAAFSAHCWSSRWHSFGLGSTVFIPTRLRSGFAVTAGRPGTAPGEYTLFRGRKEHLATQPLTKEQPWPLFAGQGGARWLQMSAPADMSLMAFLLPSLMVGRAVGGSAGA